MNTDGCHQVQSGMVMQVVVPTEESPCPDARRVNGGKTVRIIGTVLHGFELRLTEGVVVGRMRAAVAFGDAQIDQQLAQGFAFHRAAVISVKRELIGLNALLTCRLGDELLCQFRSRLKISL